MPMTRNRRFMNLPLQMLKLNRLLTTQNMPFGINFARLIENAQIGDFSIQFFDTKFFVVEKHCHKFRAILPLALKDCTFAECRMMHFLPRFVLEWFACAARKRNNFAANILIADM